MIKSLLKIPGLIIWMFYMDFALFIEVIQNLNILQKAFAGEGDKNQTYVVQPCDMYRF